MSLFTIQSEFQYEVVRKIFEGGMGIVYQARDVRLNRIVALKMILGEGQADATAVARLLVEAEAVAAIRHQNVVAIYECGECGDRVRSGTRCWETGLMH